MSALPWHVFSDPSGGGAGSNYCIVSLRGHTIFGTMPPREPKPETLFESSMTDVRTSKEERVNGFQLYERVSNLFYEEDFEHMCALADDRTQWSFRRFKEAMSDVCCSDWNKQDIHGECFGGPYKQPEGSYAKSNAYNLCFAQAVRAMWRLPFSKALLIRTIQLGCFIRQESVRYSNYLCVWLERKRLAMTTARARHALIQELPTFVARRAMHCALEAERCLIPDLNDICASYL